MSLRYPFLDLGAANAPYLDLLVEAAARVVRSGRYIGGEEVAALETELATYLGVKHVVAVSNGLDALRLILRAYILLGHLHPGDDILVPANTYIATILAITDAGLHPVLVEPDPDTLNLDTRRLEHAATPRTRAIMPVHLYGRTCWDRHLVDTAQRHGWLIIEDAAQALGAQTAATPGLGGSMHVGALGHAAGISFYPTKNLGALGDAGAVSTDDDTLADAVRALANYGSDRRYHNIYQGLNCRLDPLQAALLRVKLPHLDNDNADRFARALAYTRELRHPGIITPRIGDTLLDNVWHQYVIRVPGGKRDLLARHLADAGVGTDIHYAVPPHLQPCYAGILPPRGALPVTEQLADEVLSLPISTGISVKDASDIAHIINTINL